MYVRPIKVQSNYKNEGRAEPRQKTKFKELQTHLVGCGGRENSCTVR